MDKAKDWKAFLYQPLLWATQNGVTIRKIVMPLQMEAPFLRATLDGDSEVVMKAAKHSVEPELCGIPMRFDSRLKQYPLFVLESIEKKLPDPLKGGTPIDGTPAVLSQVA